MFDSPFSRFSSPLRRRESFRTRCDQRSFSDFLSPNWRGIFREAQCSWTSVSAAATCMMIGLTILLAGSAVAQQTLPPAPYAYNQLPDHRQEAAAQKLMLTLRCLKCQSQSIADSDAPMAGDMRHQVRARIEAGEEPEEIRAWLVERYGDYVSYAPTVSRTTWPLFAGPLLLMLVAGLLIWRRVGRRGDDIA